MTTGIRDLVAVNGNRYVLGRVEDWLEIDQSGHDRPRVEMEIPEFRKSPSDPMPIVYLRAMDQQERDEWELRWIGDQHVEPDLEKARERDRKATYRERLQAMKSQLLVHCVVNEQGRPLFTKAHIEVLQRRNAAVINRLADKANELCGFTQADRDELLKGSGETPADASPSDLPSPSSN